MERGTELVVKQNPMKMMSYDDTRGKDGVYMRLGIRMRS